MTPSLKPDASQRPAQRGAPRLAPLVGATAMAMVLAACVQTGTQAPIQYASPAQSYAAGWPTPAPPSLGHGAYSTVLSAPVSSTYLGQTPSASAGIAPFYDERLTAAPVYGPSTSYLSEAAYGLQPAPLTNSAASYALNAPIYEPQGYAAPIYAQPAPTAVASAPPIHNPAPAPTYAPTYDYAYDPAASGGGVTLYDGRLPAAPVYGAGTNYVVASAGMAPIYDPRDAYASTAQTYQTGGSYPPSSAPAPSYAPAPTAVASAPPIHNPWPPQEAQTYAQNYGAQNYGAQGSWIQSYGAIQTINDAPWADAYAAAPQISAAPAAPLYAPHSSFSHQGVSGSVYGPGLGVALNQYASTNLRGDVLLRVSPQELRGVQQVGAWRPQPNYGGTLYQNANIPVHAAPVGSLSGYDLGGPVERSWSSLPAPAPTAPAPVYNAPSGYAPPTSYAPVYAPPSTLGGAYPRPYSVSGLGIYPSSPSPAGVASARALGWETQAAAAPVFGPGTPIYADPRDQRYVREIIRLPQPQPGLTTNSAALRAGVLPASGLSYQVSSGDTLYRIARSHGIPVEALAAANGLTLNAVIHPGQPLYIPRGGIGPSTPVFEVVAQAPARPLAASAIETGSVAQKAEAGLGPRAPSPEFVWPLHGPLSAKRDAYGVTSVTVKGAPGAPVRAAAAGRAIHVENGPQGVMVVLDHGGGWTSIHVGLADVALRVGQSVAAGARIGVLAPLPEAALLFELRRNNLPVDPTSRLRG